MAKYKIKVQYTFECMFEVEANSMEEAKEDVLTHCSVALGEVTSNLLEDTIDWDVNPYPITEIVSAIYQNGS